MKLAIGNDHSAVEMKKEIKKYLEDKGIEVIDVGTNSTESFNYPISGYKVGKMVANGEVDGGVLICGTGVGISLAANKVKGIRCAHCADTLEAQLCRQHNNANMMAIGAGFTGPKLASVMVETFLSTAFEGGRHAHGEAGRDHLGGDHGGDGIGAVVRAVGKVEYQGDKDDENEEEGYLKHSSAPLLRWFQPDC